MTRTIYRPYYDEAPTVTLRWLGNRYVIADVNEPVGKDMKRFSVFGREEGGRTREEALFWAERLASKNGLGLVLPEGWDHVRPKLPSSPSEGGVGPR
jgi:hypothetical protein